LSQLRDEFIDWQMNKVGEAFVSDDQFFMERYGTFLSPFCKDLIRELLETDRRLAALEERDDDDTCECGE
jgi:hypothetical protein